MKRLSLAFVLSIIALAATPLAARASVISYDATLASPGWYQGSDNPNGGFTSFFDNGVEIDLRVKYRQNADPLHSATNVYDVVPGPQTAATSGGPANAGRAAWQYEMGLNLRPGGVGSLTLADVLSNTWITISDITAGTTSGRQSFFGSYAFDHDLHGPSGKEAESAAALMTDWEAQNSENGVFANFGIPFDMNAEHLYSILFEVGLNDTRSPLDTALIYARVGGAAGPTVPEPVTMALLGVGALGVAIRRRRIA